MCNRRITDTFKRKKALQGRILYELYIEHEWLHHAIKLNGFPFRTENCITLSDVMLKLNYSKVKV